MSFVPTFYNTNLCSISNLVNRICDESKIENNDVQQKDLAKSLIEPISIINVEPLVLHRIKALSNIYHYEVSTPFLDDVIRVDDDSNRKNGKILTEHTQ